MTAAAADTHESLQSSCGSRSIFVFVGDISADLHAAALIKQLKGNGLPLRIWGVGGCAMEAEGVELIENCQSLSVIGPVEGLKLLPRLSRLSREIMERLAADRPDLVLLVDYGGFNLKLAAQIREKFPGLPVVYFISPQVWGSRPWRIKTIEKSVFHMLVIFPFEETLYRGKGVEATFVGHPLVEKFGKSSYLSKADFCAKYGLDMEKPLVGIFPGSRRQEIKDFMSFIGQAINWLSAERTDLQFAMSRANQHIADRINDELYNLKLERLIGSRLKLIPAEDNLALMSVSDLLWTKSGTTTLEATLMEKPMLVFYRASWISFLLFLLFKQVKYVAWPNLLAGEMLVPELIQLDCRAEQLVRYTRDWLDVPGCRQRIGERLKALKVHLGKGDFAANAAFEVDRILKATAQSPGDNSPRLTGSSP